MHEAIDEALIVIDAGSGAVLDCNAPAAQLLGTARELLCGNQLGRVLAADAGSRLALEQFLAVPGRIFLPPFLAPYNRSGEQVLGGLLAPSQGNVRRLSLWPLLQDQVFALTGAVSVADVIAVLGVDQLLHDARWSGPQTTDLLATLHAGLPDFLRSQDAVLSPVGTAIVLALRAVDTAAARDICGALLSHLRRMFQGGDGPLADARLCVGLAPVAAHGGSALATLLAANNALMQARHGAGREQVHTADPADQALLTGAAAYPGGVFQHGCSVALAADSAPPEPPAVAPPLVPIERNIDGYVVDNMEGAVDQALFLAGLDMPVAIIGPAGTGKWYLARLLHEATGAAPDLLVQIDCREFHGRKQASARIGRELARGEGRTLVFKSPQLLPTEVQLKLARQISTRTLADASPPRALTAVRFVALFPDNLDRLQRKGELTPALASAFGGYPIHVPPIRDRKQAVLRWAHKILGQEGARRDREMKGFTPDAERAMLAYDWPGNISEMRQCIADALERTDRNWLTPVDLGLYGGIDPEGAPYVPEHVPFLTLAAQPSEEESYTPSTLERLDQALGEAMHQLLGLDLVKPLGTWLEDDLVLAALDRYRSDLPRAGEFLHTRPRNVSRWLPGIASRERERADSALWQPVHRLVREWVREASQQDESPLLFLQGRLLHHLEAQGGKLGLARRAAILGVSTPTYGKRLRDSAGR